MCSGVEGAEKTYVRRWDPNTKKIFHHFNFTSNNYQIVTEATTPLNNVEHGGSYDADWCNGSTLDFDSNSPGSSPGFVANNNLI